MLIAPKLLGKRGLDAQALAEDKKNAVKYDNCALGKEAVYLGTFYLPRMFYATYKDISRIYKRVAMSKGGFTGKGAFGAMSYVVIQLHNGQEHQVNFKTEPMCDAFIEDFHRAHPNIPTHSAKAERKLAEAEAKEQARYLQTLPPEAEQAVRRLRSAQRVLETRGDLVHNLEMTARNKRIIENISPQKRALGIGIAVLGLALIVAGLVCLALKKDFAWYLVVFGAVAGMFALASNTLPFGRNTRAFALRDWESAVAAMRDFLQGQPDFPLPPQFAHPLVLERMIRLLRQGSASTASEAYEAMKEELKRLNNTVKVSQAEHDEVVKVKPLFLACAYQDELELFTIDR